MLGVIFYLLAALILVSTVLAVTRRDLVHAVVYLVVSFLGSALLFYLLGAPFLAALQVIIYAGAIMVLFLFILMTVGVESPRARLFPLAQWLPAAAIGIGYLGVGAFLLSAGRGSEAPLRAATASPRVFGEYVFRHHLLAVEIVSLLLLVALVGALYLGAGRGGGTEEGEGSP